MRDTWTSNWGGFFLLKKKEINNCTTEDEAVNMTEDYHHLLSLSWVSRIMYT